MLNKEISWMVFPFTSAYRYRPLKKTTTKQKNPPKNNKKATKKTNKKPQQQQTILLFCMTVNFFVLTLSGLCLTPITTF